MRDLSICRIMGKGQRMRLIDVDLYCATICKCNRRACDRAKCPIHNAPTAYSVDKVVEELNRIRAKKTCNKEKCDTKEICRICVVDDAIEIVKQGGKEQQWRD